MELARPIDRKYLIITGVLVLSGFVLGMAAAKLPLLLTSILALVIAGVALVIFCIINPMIGFCFALVIPFVGFELQRFVKADLPVGLIAQGIFLLLLIVLLFKKKVAGNSGFGYLSNPIMYVSILIQIHLIVQGLNPDLDSLQGWWIIMRGSFAILLVYIVTLLLYDGTRFLKTFIGFWIVLATISALYACYQEWISMPSYVINWVHATTERFRLIYIMSDYRKFSLLSDPAAFGIFMCSSSLITIILAFRPTKRSYRALLLGASLFMILAMAYSGTRTAYAMFVAGLIMFLFMTINNKRTLIFSAVAIFAVFVLLFGPIYGNATINRIRSTFNSEDASLNVRDRNRATIQEYIYSHPMGGGVMTTGDAGMKYNPNHRLAGFPPDSGYLKIVLETGWTGLFLAVLFFYVCLRQGIKNFYHTQDENIRYYYLAITAMVFSISIGSYAQSVHTQVPIMLFFYPSVALLTRISYSELIPQK